MSEFSDSLHLRGDDPDLAVALLSDAGLRGFVFPSVNGWIAIAHETPRRDSMAAKKLFSAKRGTLISYSFAADHGCWVDAYVGGKRVGRLARSFESDDSAFDRSAFVSYNLLSSRAAATIEEWLARDDEYEREERYTVARELGLTRYQWFSFAYEIDADEPAPGRIAVGVEVVPRQALEPAAKAPKTKAPKAKAAKKKAAEPSHEIDADALQALSDLTDILAAREGKPKRR